MIEDFTKIEKLFLELNSILSKKVRVYVIGGAALLRRGMKDATKDIDLVIATKHEFLEIQNALIKMKFIPQIPGKEYSHMNLSQIFLREDFRIDLFEKSVCGKFCLSEKMMQRAEKVVEQSAVVVSLCSSEDIFLFKTMTEREGDIDDCVAIATRDIMKWSIILEELQHQIKQSKQDVWITWVGERFDLLVERGLDIPIMNEMDSLRENYFVSFEKKDL